MFQFSLLKIETMTRLCFPKVTWNLTIIISSKSERFLWISLLLVSGFNYTSLDSWLAAFWRSSSSPSLMSILSSSCLSHSSLRCRSPWLPSYRSYFPLTVLLLCTIFLYTLAGFVIFSQRLDEKCHIYIHQRCSPIVAAVKSNWGTRIYIIHMWEEVGVTVDWVCSCPVA